MKRRLLTENELEEIKQRSNPDDIPRLITNIKRLENRLWKVRQNVLYAAISEMDHHDDDE